MHAEAIVALKYYILVGDRYFIGYLNQVLMCYELSPRFIMLMNPSLIVFVNT